MQMHDLVFGGVGAYVLFVQKVFSIDGKLIYKSFKLSIQKFTNNDRPFWTYTQNPKP